MACSLRSAARTMGCCGVNPARRNSSHAVVTLTETWNIRPISVQTRAKVHRWSSTHPAAAGPCSSTASRRCTWASDNRRSGPGAPCDASACSPPAAQDRRHAYADFVETSSAAATCTALIPSANIRAACRRICSRRARPCGPTPPPSPYRTPGQRDTRTTRNHPKRRRGLAANPNHERSVKPGGGPDVRSPSYNSLVAPTVVTNKVIRRRSVEARRRHRPANSRLGAEETTVPAR